MTDAEITEVVRLAYSDTPPDWSNEGALVERIIESAQDKQCWVVEVQHELPRLGWDLDHLEWLGDNLTPERYDELSDGAEPTVEEERLMNQAALDKRSNEPEWPHHVAYVYRFCATLDDGIERAILLAWVGNLDYGNGVMFETEAVLGPLTEVAPIKPFLETITGEEFRYDIADTQQFPEQGDFKEWLQMRQVVAWDKMEAHLCPLA